MLPQRNTYESQRDRKKPTRSPKKVQIQMNGNWSPFINQLAKFMTLTIDYNYWLALELCAISLDKNFIWHLLFILESEDSVESRATPTPKTKPKPKTEGSAPGRVAW